MVKPLKSCFFIRNIMFPNGGGSQGDFIREPQYEIQLEDSRVSVRSRSVKNGAVVRVPIHNVACYEEHDEPKPGVKAP